MREILKPLKKLWKKTREKAAFFAARISGKKDPASHAVIPAPTDASETKTEDLREEQAEKLSRGRRTAALAAACLVLIVLFLALPGILLKQEDSRISGQIYFSEQPDGTGSTLEYLDLDSFYNRLMLMTGLWESSEVSVTSSFDFSDRPADSRLEKLTVGFRDTNGEWHSNDALLRDGNVIQAVCNLSEFELLPYGWNAYYADWTIDQVQAWLFQENVLQTYSCILYEIDLTLALADSEDTCQVQLFVDDESGDFVGIRVTEPEGSNTAFCEDWLWVLKEVKEASEDGYPFVRLLISRIEKNTAYENYRTDVILGKTFEDLGRTEGEIEEDLYVTRIVRFSGQSAEGENSVGTKKNSHQLISLQTVLNETTADLVEEGAMSVVQGQEGEQLFPDLEDYLERLGFVDAACLTDEALIREIVPVEGFSSISENALVYSCTEFSSGNQYYFVINEKNGTTEIYFTPATGKVSGNALTEN